MTQGLISTVASNAGIARHVALRIAKSASKRYKYFKIKKRDGSYRAVAQPAREVKALQRSIVDHLSKLLPVHACATAYQPKSSILQNAQRHAGARYLLKFDFSQFFPSIDAIALTKHLMKTLDSRISQAEVRFILDACLWREPGSDRHCLCIGAPSSPFLSNSVMYNFDVDFNEFCLNNNVKYTRYSDDITLSAVEPNILAMAEYKLRDLCNSVDYPRLSINEIKRVSVSKKTTLNVTGLTLTNNGGVSVGRARKRGVRSGVHDFVMRRLDAEMIERLKGELAFVLSVEPEYRGVLLRTYGPSIITILPRLRRQDAP